MDANRILNILADGDFHSGESIGEVLGISRSAVWKQVSQLEKLGLEINSVKGRGYRLARPIELLAVEKIMRHLDEREQQLFRDIDVKSTVGSTNDEVKAKDGAPYVCLAEAQSSGRGRRGRDWISPYGTNIYLSVAWSFDQLSGSLDGLSLCVGIAVARAIEQLVGLKAGLKWPNDLVYEQKKLAGVLLELEGELSGPMRVIIGIGVNVEMSRAAGADIDQQWVSLSEISRKTVSRNQLAAQILSQLADILPEFEQHGFSRFTGVWREFDVLENVGIYLVQPNKRITGVAKGVSENGELLVATGNGVEVFRSGEVSVRVDG